MLLGLALCTLLASVVAEQRHAHACYYPGSALPADFKFAGTKPGKWGDPAWGTGATVTYSFAAVAYPGETAGNDVVPLSWCMPPGHEAEIARAFAAWSAAANIDFVEVPDSGLPYGTGSEGNIRIGCHKIDGPLGVLAHGYFPPNNGGAAAGDIHFDLEDTYAIGYGNGGVDIFQLAGHEIGHAIGLTHEASPLVLMYPYYTEAFSGPQPDDIAGAQALYGVRPATDAAVQQLTALVNGLVGEVAALKAQLNDEARFTSDAELASHRDAIKAAVAQSQTAAHADYEKTVAEVVQMRNTVNWIAQALYKEHHNK